MPAIYCLLPHKRKETYINFLNLLKAYASSKNFNLNLPNFRVDIEIGMINAIKNVFPYANIKLCLFHFTQSIFRAVQRFNLTNQYLNDERFKLLIRKLMALPLLSTDLVFAECQFILQLTLMIIQHLIKNYGLV